MPAWLLAVNLLVLLALLAFELRSYSDQHDMPGFFGLFVRGYRRLDEKQGIRRADYVFTGSSVMKFWKTMESDLAPASVLNRAIAGAKIGEIRHHAAALISTYSPKAVFLYAGSNDIQGKKPRSADQVLGNFRAMVEELRARDPAIQVYFVSILVAPAKARLRNRAEIERANQLVREHCEGTEGLHFVDLTPDFTTKSGAPKAEYFTWDKIHLTPAGYEIWKRRIRPLVTPAE